MEVIMSATAVVVAFISLIIALFVHRDSQNTNAINQVYGLFNEGVRAFFDDSILTYMFVLSESYYEMKGKIREGVGYLSPKERAELLLKERAFALYLFQCFEFFYYQLKYSGKVIMRKRHKFLRIVLNHFTERLLRNPRLLYYWNESGGKLSSYFEPETKKYYHQKVIMDLGCNVEDIMDKDGLFGNL